MFLHAVPTFAASVARQKLPRAGVEHLHCMQIRCQFAGQHAFTDEQLSVPTALALQSLGNGAADYSTRGSARLPLRPPCRPPLTTDGWKLFRPAHPRVKRHSTPYLSLATPLEHLHSNPAEHLRVCPVAGLV
jgi:hypothetical protein